MSFATWLPAALRAEGLRVVEVSGWETRSTWDSGLNFIDGVVIHHTGPWNIASIVSILVNGRSDLAGPLSQLGLAPDGTVYVVAAGRANHNGFGTYVPGWAWGNASIGVEMFNNGTTEPWPQAQWDAAVRVATAILRHLGLDAHHTAGHKETDPRRKPDPSRWDMDAFRVAVARRLSLPPDQEDDEMPSIEELRQLQQEDHDWWTAEHNRLQKDQSSRLATINSTLKAIRDYLKARFGATSDA